MLVLAIIVGVLFAIAFLPIHVVVHYDHRGLYADVRLFFLKKQLYPPDNREEKRIKREARNEKLLDMGSTILSAGGPVRELVDALKMVFDTVGRLRRRLRVRTVQIVYTAAGDPFHAAMSYAGVNAGLGTLVPLIDYYFKVRSFDIQTDVDYEAEEASVIAHAETRLFIWEHIYIYFGILAYAVKLSTNYAQMKGGMKNGKASH